MRIDKETTQLAFDNMENRAIKGTTDWLKYDVVLDIPKDAPGIFLESCSAEQVKFGLATRTSKLSDPMFRLAALVSRTCLSNPRTSASKSEG